MHVTVVEKPQQNIRTQVGGNLSSYDVANAA